MPRTPVSRGYCSRSLNHQLAGQKLEKDSGKNRNKHQSHPESLTSGYSHNNVLRSLAARLRQAGAMVFDCKQTRNPGLAWSRMVRCGHNLLKSYHSRLGPWNPLVPLVPAQKRATPDHQSRKWSLGVSDLEIPLRPVVAQASCAFQNEAPTHVLLLPLPATEQGVRDG